MRAATDIIACPSCDLILHRQPLARGERALCPRCHTVTYYETQQTQWAQALLLAGLCLYLPSIYLPFISLEISGQAQGVSLLGSVWVIYGEQNYFLAITVLLLVILAPLLRLLGLLALLSPTIRQRFGGTTNDSLRLIAGTAPWNMIEVYLVGVTVALVKLGSMASIEISAGFVAFGLLILVNALLSIALPNKRIWQICYSAPQPPSVARDA